MYYVMYLVLCSLFITVSGNVSNAGILQYKQISNLYPITHQNNVLLAHSRRNYERYDDEYDAQAGKHKPSKRGWRSYRRKYEDEIREFGRGPTRGLPDDKAAYYYYNYKRGYITDNCEYIRAPIRVCWYDRFDRRQCRWKLKWRYNCF